MANIPLMLLAASEARLFPGKFGGVIAPSAMRFRERAFLLSLCPVSAFWTA